MLATDAVITPERETAVDADGWLFDVHSGEVLGFTGLPDAFAIDSPEAADAALELRSRVEGNIAGLRERKAALAKQMDALINAQVRRLSWWEWRFLPNLVAFARGRLTGRSRTWQGSWGRVSFRTTQGSTEILDDAAALAFVQEWAPELVKVVRSVGVKAVAEAARVARETTGEDVPTPFVKASGRQEKADVSTGIFTGGEGS